MTVAGVPRGESNRLHLLPPIRLMAHSSIEWSVARHSKKDDLDPIIKERARETFAPGTFSN